jgi:hypothetical protein
MVAVVYMCSECLSISGLTITVIYMIRRRRKQGAMNSNAWSMYWGNQGVCEWLYIKSPEDFNWQC